MNTKSSLCAVLEIRDADRLDPITVFVQDLAPGRGRLTIECYGAAWSTYWGAMGDRTIRDMVIGCESDYIVNRLVSPEHRRSMRSLQYLERIVKAVQMAMARSSPNGSGRDV